MTALVTYKRIYQLSVGVINEGAFVPFTSIESPHHMEFKSKEKIPNKGRYLNGAKIRLYNIGLDNINQLKYKGASIILRAGWQYQDGLNLPPDLTEIVFIGDIVNVNTKQEGGDKVTTVEVYEGWNSTILEMSKSPVLIGKGLTAKQAFEQIKTHFTIPFIINFKSMDSLVTKKPCQIPYELPDALDWMCKNFSGREEGENGQPDTVRRLTWFYHRNRIYITDRLPRQGQFRGFFQTHTIQRGRIKDSPEVGQDTKVLTKGFEDEGTRYLKFTSYLHPEVKLFDSVKLESVDYDDLGGEDFVVTEVEHNLSYDGDYWDTTITARSEE